MDSEFAFGEWKGRFDAGLPQKQVEVIVLAFNDFTEKMSARHLGLSPICIQKRLQRAKDKLSQPGKPIRSTQALCLEAMKRGIIAPLVLLLCLATGLTTVSDRPSQRPVRAPKVASVMRAYRQEAA